MADSIKYFLNTSDIAQPVYEVNYSKGTFRTVHIHDPSGYDRQHVRGKIRKPTNFTAYCFKEVPRPAQAA